MARRIVKRPLDETEIGNMKYVRVGNAGIEASRFALGCMDFALRHDL